MNKTMRMSLGYKLVHLVYASRLEFFKASIVDRCQNATKFQYNLNPL